MFVVPLGSDPLKVISISIISRLVKLIAQPVTGQQLGLNIASDRVAGATWVCNCFLIIALLNLTRVSCFSSFSTAPRALTLDHDSNLLILFAEA